MSSWREPKSPIVSEAIDFTAQHWSLLANLLMMIGVVLPSPAASAVQLALDAAERVDPALRPLDAFAKEATKDYGEVFSQHATSLREGDRSAAEIRAVEITRQLRRRDAYVAALRGTQYFERLALADEAVATDGMSEAGAAYLKDLVRQTGVLVARYLRAPKIFGIVAIEALRDLDDALTKECARQDEQGRSIEGLDRRVTRLEDLRRDLADELARRAPMTTVLGPDAWGIPLSWDPLGPDHLPVTQEHGLRLDVLWARDRSPFRAVLADAPDAPLADILGRGTLALTMPTQRKWASWSMDGEDVPTSRAQLLMVLGLEGSDPGSFGVVTTLDGSATANLRAAAQRGLFILRELARLLPAEPVVLRVESGSAERSIRLAALVGRSARTTIPIEVLTRLHTTDGAEPTPGGDSNDAVALLCDTVRRRRQTLGAEAPWPPFSDAVTREMGADTADAVPSELSRSMSLPECVSEADFLRHVRDSCADIWPVLVKAYARSTDPARWWAGLSAASDWADDLECWITTCNTVRGSLLECPDLFRVHYDMVVDRLILALRVTHQHLVNLWLPRASPGLQETLHPRPLTKQLPPLAKLLAARAPDLLTGSNREVFRLSRDDAASVNALEAAGVAPEAVLSLVATPAQDPDLRDRISYFRRIVRPYLEET